jgi:hypothetical protein
LKHPTEDSLIAYLMHESGEAAAIAEHLERCPECTHSVESIAETLRVFSAEPVPDANLDHAWQRLRVSLPPLARPARSGWTQKWSWLWLLLPAALGALLIAFIAIHHRHSGSNARISPPPVAVQPRDPEIAGYLDSAERLLTELKHSSGPLDEADRLQAHDLLLSNALYLRKAEDRNDTVDAAVLDRLDRTLTNLEHEQTTQEAGSAQSDTESLLLDLRILEQNNSTSTKEIQ